jgi:hypothetical protein
MHSLQRGVDGMRAILTRIFFRPPCSPARICRNSSAWVGLGMLGLYA